MKQIHEKEWKSIKRIKCDYFNKNSKKHRKSHEAVDNTTTPDHQQDINLINSEKHMHSCCVGTCKILFIIKTSSFVFLLSIMVQIN